MDTELIIAAVALFLLLALLWFVVFVSGPDPQPPRPYDPLRQWLHRFGSRPTVPSEPRRHYCVTGEPDDVAATSEVVVGRIVSRTGGCDESREYLDLNVDVGGRVVELHEAVGSSTPGVPGALVPIRFHPRTRIAEGLDEAEVRRVLLEYRHDRGLLDDTAHAILSTGRTEHVTVRRTRPTGRLRSDHIEVTVDFDAPDGTDQRVTGFLRPQEIAAVRQFGTVPATTDDEGRWALGPTWY